MALNIKFDMFASMKTMNSLNIARSYHKYDNVQSFKIEKKGLVYLVESIVMVNGENYHCSFYFNESGKISNEKCNCPYCKVGDPCAHVGAVLFKINVTYIDELPFYYQKQEKKNSFDIMRYVNEQYEKRKKQELEEKQQREEQLRLEEEKRREENRQQHDLLMERIRQFNLEQEEKARKAREEQERRRILHLQERSNFLVNQQRENRDNHVLAMFDTTTYSLYPEIVYKNGCELEYRIGTKNKKYIVKSLSDLVNAFQSKQIISYGKNRSIVHEQSRFDEFSNQQMNFIEKVSSKPRKTYYDALEYIKLGRSIPLNGGIPGALHLFCETYQDYEDGNFVIIEGDINIEIELTEENGGYVLYCESCDEFLIENNELIKLPKQHASTFVIERVKLDEQHVFEKLIKEFNVCDGYIYIHKDHWTDFYKYILQPIDKFITLKGDLPDEGEETSYARIEVRGDVNENGEIEFDVEYIDQSGTIIPAFQEATVLDFNQEIVEMVMKKYASSVGLGKAYFNNNDERTLKFCSEGVLKLQEYCDVYISEALKRVGQRGKQTISVGVRVENDLIALDISSLEIPKDELASVLNSYRRKKKFYRLKSGEMINIDSEEMEALDQLMDEYHLDAKELKNEEIKLNKYRMFDLEETTNKEDKLIVSKEQSYQHLLEDFKELSTSEIEIPDSYKDILRDYQKDGYRWLYTMYSYGFNGILADDMGLGKTLQVIAFLEGIQTNLPSIVVCPASLIYNWEDEVHKFSKTLKVGCVVGTKAQRRQFIEDASNYDLLVTSYDYMRRDFEDYQNTQFEYIILDEAQNIKNQKTKNASSVKELKGNHRLALTGTPIENTLAELWSIFDFLMPDYLFNYHYFKKTYESPIVKNGDESMSKKLKRLVSPFILRRNKKDVLKELPEKIETLQVIPFEEEENKLYLANLAKINEQLAQLLEVDQMDKFLILSMLTRLRQICIEPRMLYENIDEPSSKMKALFELLEQLKENHQKTLVFSAFPSVFDYLETDLQNANISYMKLTGKNTKEERREMVEQFQNGDIDVFLISLKAGGTGLNLTKASAVIHIDPWWNLSAQNQATDRAHRIGQENMVQVFKLVMKNSIEEKIVKLQDKKKELADLFVENNEGSIARMSKNEIIDLFKMN